MASKTVTRSTTQTFNCCAKISFLISIVISFFIVLDTWQDKSVMWHSSERVYLCTGEWFTDFPFLTKTTKSGYRVFFEISLKTIRPSCILTGHLIYERTPFLNKAAPRNKNFVQKALRGEEGMGWWLGKKGKESFPTLSLWGVTLLFWLFKSFFFFQPCLSLESALIEALDKFTASETLKIMQVSILMHVIRDTGGH